MRFAFTLLSYVLCASLLPLVVATHPVVLSSYRDNKKHSPSRTYPTAAYALRQHHEPRGLIDIDICASVDATVLARVASLLGLGPLHLDSNLDLCLCLKNLDLFIRTDASVRGLVQLLGPDTVNLLLRLLLNTSPNAQQCTLPSHAHRTCNKDDPCHWQCDADWTRQGNQCVCPSPRTVCQDRCSTSCPSTHPHKRGQGEDVAPAKADDQHENHVASSNLNPDLFNRIRVLANLVIKLREHSKSDAEPSNCDTDAEDALAGGVLNLLTAPVVGSLLEAVHDLLGLATDLNATALVGANDPLPGLILHAVVGLNDWCSSNPILADGASQEDSPIQIDLPIDLGLLESAGGLLGLGSSASGAGTIPVVLPNGSLNPNLLVELDGLINLVINLRTNATHILPTDSLINIDLFLPLFDATAQLLNSTSPSDLLSALVNLGDCATQVGAALDGSGLHLEPLLDQVIKIADLALNIRALCGDQDSGTYSPTTASSGDGDSQSVDGEIGAVPLIVDADSLLNSLGLPGLGIVATVDGLGDGLTDTLNGLLGSLGLGGGADISSSPPNTTSPQSPSSSLPPVDLLSNILVDASALLDNILDLRVGGRDLASACGLLGQPVSPEAQPVLGILAGVNNVLHASVNLGNTTDLTAGLSVLSRSLIRLEDGLEVHIDANLQNVVNNLLATVDTALGTLARVHLGLGRCGCSRNDTLLAGLQSTVRHHRHALVDVGL